MSKLQILIPQYNETNETIKPLLDSIAIQQSIDFNDIEVIIGNDGSNTKLTADFLNAYSYKIQYHSFNHEGLAATRKKLQSLASADYIMFCDADDSFISTIALQIILSQTIKSFDILSCTFLEECRLPNNQIDYIPRQNDAVFVHGKVYRRQFLLDNKIEWNPTLREHQDSAFNVLAHILSKSTKYCVIPLYLWHDNSNSISRKDGILHAVNTWPAMIDSYQSLVNDLKNRGCGQESCYYAKYCLYATYFEMGNIAWQSENIEEQKKATYKRLHDFYIENELLIKNCNEESTKQIIKVTKRMAESRKGKLCDLPPFEEWLRLIITLW